MNTTKPCPVPARPPVTSNPIDPLDLAAPGPPVRPLREEGPEQLRTQNGFEPAVLAGFAAGLALGVMLALRHRRS